MSAASQNRRVQRARRPNHHNPNGLHTGWANGLGLLQLSPKASMLTSGSHGPSGEAARWILEPCGTAVDLSGSEEAAAGGGGSSQSVTFPPCASPM